MGLYRDIDSSVGRGDQHSEANLMTSRYLRSAVTRILCVGPRSGGWACFHAGMSEPLRVRPLIHEQGRQIQRIVRCGGGKIDKLHVKWRRALVVHTSAGGNTARYGIINAVSPVAATRMTDA